MSDWYTSLEKQLKWEHYTELMKIVQPSAEDWRSLTIVRANTKPSRKLANKDIEKD